MNILVINSGSSSLRFQVISTDAEAIANDGDRSLAKGLIERLGGMALITLESGKGPPRKEAAPLRDHRAALEHALRWLVSPKEGADGLKSLSDIHAVGHRVVHGGELFKQCVLVNDEVVRGVEGLLDLAPLHNPANLKGIAAAREILGTGIPQAAVFDTSFHSSMPETSYLYALPYSLYRRYGLRRYGFHGTSFRYVAYRYGRLTRTPKDRTDIVALHLGNGASACAIKGGRSMDTSMGLTPLEGLVMGTRSGDVDPSIMEYLYHKEGLSIAETDALLNKQSGLLGISGLTNDMRDLLAEERDNKDRRAALAIDIFCSRARKYVGAYLAAMGGAQAVVFTGGIGENAPEIRARIAGGLEWMGLTIDPEKNEAAAGGAEGEISEQGSRLKAYVIPTDEELLIARDTARLVLGLPLPG